MQTNTRNHIVIDSDGIICILSDGQQSMKTTKALTLANYSMIKANIDQTQANDDLFYLPPGGLPEPRLRPRAEDVLVTGR